MVQTFAAKLLIGINFKCHDIMKLINQVTNCEMCKITLGAIYMEDDLNVANSMHIMLDTNITEHAKYLCCVEENDS